MNWIDAFFFLFSFLAILSTLGILFTRNVIYAAFFLVACLLSFAALYVLYGATYLAVVQLLVYAGGVVVLLSFGIMLTTRADGKLLTRNHLYFPGVLVFVLLIIAIAIMASGSPVKQPINADTNLQINEIGILLMTEYLLAFELIAFLLLVVLVGAVFIAKKAAP